MLTYLQAIIIGVLQGVTELAPVSSLGHSVLLPTLLGWSALTKEQSKPESYFLAFLVVLHVATAVSLIAYFWKDWLALIKGFFRSIANRRIGTGDERVIWLLIVATIPAGIVGLSIEHVLRTVFAKPLAAAAFLVVNAGILFVGEKLRRRPTTAQPTRKLETLSFTEAIIVGVAQVAALFAGISRSGITMVAGLSRGMDHEDAARFSFLLATPIILGAGLYKIPDLLGPLGDGIRMKALVGGVAAAIAALLTIKFLMRYFETRSLKPFAIYCAVFGTAMLVFFGLIR